MYYVPLFREVLYIRYGTPCLSERARVGIVSRRNTGTAEHGPSASERRNPQSDQAADSEPPLHARRLLLNRPTPTQRTSARYTASKHTTD